MRIIARFEKCERVRFVSHLDVQRLFQRAIRRADIPVAFSNGFNPHPLLSFATALSVGQTSEAEWLDVKLESAMDIDDFSRRLNDSLPEGVRVLEAMEIDDTEKTLTALMQAAQYNVSLQGDITGLQNALDVLQSGEIIVNKRTKAGMRDVDIRPQLISCVLDGQTLHITGRADASGSLNVDLFMASLLNKYGKELRFHVHRCCIFFDKGHNLPSLEGLDISAEAEIDF